MHIEKNCKTHFLFLTFPLYCYINELVTFFKRKEVGGEMVFCKVTSVACDLGSCKSVKERVSLCFVLLTDICCPSPGMVFIGAIFKVLESGLATE